MAKRGEWVTVREYGARKGGITPQAVHSVLGRTTPPPPRTKRVPYPCRAGFRLLIWWEFPAPLDKNGAGL